MDAICWGKATIASEPSNEHDPYAVAVLKNVGGRKNSRWFWLHYSPLHCKAQGLHLWFPVPLEGVGVVEAIPALGQACNKDTMSYMQACNNDTRGF